MEGLGAGRQVRAAAAGEEPALHRRRGAHAGPRHRRQHGDLLAHGPDAVPRAAGAGPRTAGGPRRARAEPGLAPSAQRTVDPISYPMFEDFRDRRDVFRASSPTSPARPRLGASGETERAEAALVSGNYFEVLGVAPALGRLLAPEDDKPPRRPSRRRALRTATGSAASARIPACVGKSILVNGHPMTVLGVSAARLPRRRGRQRGGRLRAAHDARRR